MKKLVVWCPLALFGAFLFTGLGVAHAERIVLGSNTDDPATMMDYVATPSGSEPIPQSSDLETTILANSVKLGEGGVNDHIDFFEDYGETVLLTNGNIVSVWRARNNASATPSTPDGDGYGVFFRILSPAGAQVAGPVAPYLDINPDGTGDQNRPFVTALTGGGFAMTWNSNGGPGDVGSDTFSGGDTYVRVYDDEGQPVSGTLKVNESQPSGVDDHQFPEAMIGLSDGGFAVVWRDDNNNTGNKDDFFVRSFDADGTPRGTSTRLGPNHDDFFERLGNAVALEDGRFAISWSTDDPVWGTPDSIGADGDLDAAAFFRVFNADGSGFTGPIRPYLSINPTGQGHQWELSLTTLADGNLALAWNSVNGPGDVFDDGFGYGGDTYTAVFTPAGDLVGSVVKVNDLHDDSGETPVVIEALPFGGYAVVWLRTDPSQFDYFVRVHGANGAALNPSVRVSPDSDTMFEDFGNLAVLSDGGFVLGLRIRDTNNNGTGDSVDGEGFAAGLRVFNADGTARSDLFFPYLDINPDGSGSQNSPLISADPWGGFAVTWNSAGNDNDGADSDFGAGGNSTSGGDTWTRFYDNQGLSLVDTLRAHPSIPDEVTGTVDEQRPMDIVVISAGQWAVVFRDENNFTDNKDDMFVSVFSVTGRMDQTLDFPAIADQTAGDEVILDATATSGLPVSYSVSGPADLDGTTLTFTGGGEVTVTAMQAGNVSWNPAEPVVRTFTVGAASPLELVIDLGTEEIYLTGEYTSPEVTVDADGEAFYRLGLNDWLGGTSLTGEVVNVTASSSFFLPSSLRTINVAGSQGSLSIDLGRISPGPDPVTTTLAAVGNDEVRSFAGLSATSKAFLATLDGRELYFQEDQQDIAVAGTIRVRGPNRIETVLVGDAGNLPQSSGNRQHGFSGGDGFGSVDYEYFIGKYPVTNAQYAAFLNAVAASDPYGLYTGNMVGNRGGIERSGSEGSYTYQVKSNFGNKPVNFVSFWSAARFANWLSSGDTESGVYVLTENGIENNTITRDSTAWDEGGVAVASEDEWFKAAYYDPITGFYSLFPTQSDTAPDAVAADEFGNGSAGDTGNFANFNQLANWNGTDFGNVTTVGSNGGPSYYGTFDQGGNVNEWNDEIVEPDRRVMRGGAFRFSAPALRSSLRSDLPASSRNDDRGFRITSLNPIDEVPILVVTTTADVVNPMDGHTSLREALAYAATLGGPQTITFSDSNENGAVNFHDGTFRILTLSGEELVISSDVTIIGPGAELLAVSGNNASRVLRIESDTEVTLEHLSLRSGNAAGNGGGILNAGTLVLREIGMAFHSAVANGGAIYNSGDLEVHGSRFFLNLAPESGGAIYHSGGTGNLTIETTVFEQNSSLDGGAIYSFDSAQFSVNQSTFSENSAPGEGGAIYLRFSPQAVVTNSTFAYQISSSPLWIADSSTDLTLRHVTLIEPTSSLSPNGGSLTLQNTLLVGEMADGFTDEGGNLIVEFEIQAGLELTVGTAVLADNGGPTPTVALVAGSPALFAGVPSAVMVDQRGIARPDGFAPDIGAFEAEGNAGVTLSDLTQTFDGDEKTVSFTTDPAELDVQVTYNGSTEAPVDAGTYTVRAVTTSAGTFGGATGTLTIGEADQTITFGEITDQFINASLTLGATASSSLPVSYSVDGPAVLDGTTLTFNGTGTVTVTAMQAGDNNWNEAVSVGQTFEVTKVPATVTISNLTQTFDNDPKLVTVTTNPDSLDVTVTYEGETTPPTNAGTYAVVATVDSDTFEGSASDTLVINPAEQTITFLPLDDVLSTDTVNLTATATSGLPVSYSVSGPAILAGNSLTFTSPGEVIVTATQSGNTNWNEADPVEQSFTVGAPSQLELVIDLGTEEIYLTGEYTSPEVTVDAGSFASYRLGLNDWLGGTSLTGEVVNVTASSSFFLPNNLRTINVAGSQGSLSIDLGRIDPVLNPVTTTLEAVGNDEIRSFAALSAAGKAFLATLDGQELYFQEDRQDIAVAGTIRVRGPNLLETVLVGDADNPGDTTGYGGVDYEFHIGKFPVTNAQYAAFLNAVAANGDPHELWNPNMESSVHGGISRSGAGTTEDPFVYRVRTATSGFNNDQSMGNRPVNFVSFWDAARFTNWLTSGDTEIGVYPLGNVTNPTNNTITRDATAWANGGIAVAGENEWYKAAYYDPTLNSGSGGYWLYPAQSDSAPTATIPNNTDPNSVNQSGSLSPEGNTVTPAGGYTLSNSYYGTFDQGGNVWEWNDEILFSLSRGLRGGSFSSFDNTLRSSLRSSSNPSHEDDDIGFRITSLNPPLAEVLSLVVTTTADIVNPNDGHTSLREAIAYAAGLGGQQTITFSDANENGAINFHDGTARTLLLDGTELVSLSDISIVGPGEERLTISGDQRSRILTVETGDTVSISGLSFAEGAGEEQGGAIRNFGTLTLTDTRFVENGAMGSGIIDGPPIDGPPPGEGEGPIDGGPEGPLSLAGGAIYNEGELAVERSTFLFNLASIGGALMNSGTLTVEDSLFIENEAFFGGAILNEGDLSITGSTLAGNSASLGGGALASDGQVSLVNTTFVDNNASDGGAILNIEDGEISVSFVTLASNDADEGSAFFNEGDLTLRNTLVAGILSGPWTDDGNNLVVATPVEAGLAINAVDRADLTDNGGLTPTVALLSGSQALGAGRELTGITTDQRGVARPQGSAPDIGAFERPLDTQEIIFDEIATQVANTPLNLAASASSGLPVIFVLVDGPATLEDNTLTFSGEGTVQIQATQPGNPSFLAAEPLTRSFAVEKAVVDVTITDLNQTFTGGPRPVTVTTVPADLTVEVTYDGLPDAPSAAGSYPVVATVVSDIYEGSATGTLIIGNAPQTITFDPEPVLTQLVNAEVILSATASSGLPVSFAVTSGPGVIANGNELSFTGEGDVVVTATQGGDDDWDPAVPVDLTFTVSKVPATVTITDLDRIFTGEAKAVTVTTVPDSLTVEVTYDGEPDAPTAVGSYSVVATINEQTYEGTATETLIIAEAPSLVVTTLNDVVDATDGQTSLREAIAHAADLGGEQTITFSDTDADGAVNFHDGSFRTLWLDGMELTIFSDVTIEGPGAAALNISADEQSRIFQVEADAVVTLSGLRFSGGRHPLEGGAVRNAGNLTLMDSYLFDNGPLAGDRPIIDGPPGDGLPPEGDPVPPPPMFGGAVYNDGMLTVINCAFSDNNATFGGGIANDGDMSVVNSTFTENGAFEGGAVHTTGSALILHVTIAGNIAEAGQSLWIDSGADVDLNNSIVLGPIEGAFLDTDSNLIGGTFEDAGLETDGSGGLVFQNNWGQTPTIALVAGSPALFAGMPVEGVPADQRGVARPQGFAPDLGAYEAEINADVILGDLTQTFDNTPKAVSVTTDPADLVVRVTYDGSSEAPTDAGSYTVVAVIESDGYFGGATDTLIINKGDQTLDFTAIPDQEPGNTVTLEASTGSGLPVSFAVTSGPGTITEGDQLSFTGEGSVVVTASQGGDDNWNAAEPVSQTIEVREFSQLELVIDLGAEEIYLTGEYTSPEVTVDADSYASYRLGLNDWVGGYIIDGDVLSVTTSSPFLWIDNPHDITVSSNQDNLNIELGDLHTTLEPATTITIEVLGNDEVRSFANLNAATKTYLAALDGRILQLQELSGPGGYQDIAPAGTIRVIGKLNQTITFDPIGDQTTSDTVTLDATATSGLPVSYSVTGPATLNGSTLTFTGPGEVTVTASQAGDEIWNGAEPVSQSITVSEPSQLELVIDIGTQEVYLTGEYISPEVTVPADSGAMFRLGLNQWQGGAIISGDVLSVTAASSSFRPDDFRDLAVAGTEDSLFVELGDISTFEDPATTTIEVVGNDEVRSFASLSAVDKAFLATLDGRSLQFQELRSPGTYQDIAVAGTIRVIETEVETPSLIVTTTEDIVDPTDEETSLREAIAYAATLDGPQTITFSDSTDGGAINFFDGTPRTITLGGEQLTVSSDVTIIGPGANLLSVSGDESSRVMLIEADTEVTLTGFTVRDGEEDGGEGGGIRNEGTLTLLEMAIQDNETSSGFGGGGVFNSPVATLTIRGSTLSTNRTTANGGGLLNNFGTVHIENSTFSGNHANGFGGAFLNSGVGGVQNATVIHGTITENTAISGPGGIHLAEAETLLIRGSMIADNTGSSARSADVNGIFFSGGHNLIGVEGLTIGWVSSDQLGTEDNPLNPLLGPLQDNGGPTPTHALLAGSPALFAAVPVGGLDADQRGIARPQAFAPDIGAFEAEPTAMVTLSDLIQTFDGTEKTVSVTTDPAELNVVITYNGVATPPIEAGSYTVVAIVDDGDEIGGAMDTLTINKGNQVITFDSIDDQFINASLSLDATASSGLPVSYSVTGPANLDGSTLTFNDTGEVTVTASQAGDDNWNEAEDVVNTFNVTKVTAEVILSDLNQTFTGEPRPVTVTTVPADLTVEVTYDGLPDAPSAAGSYPVVATVVSDIYQGSATGTLIIGNAPQTITFDPEPDLNPLANAVVTLNATASSGLSVSLDITSGPGVLTSGNELSFTAADVVVVTATQDGDDDWDPASPVELTFIVSKAPAAVTITDLNQTFTGDPIEVTVSTDPDNLTVDVTYDGEPDAPTAVGSYSVVATINNPTYEGTATETLVISEVPSLVVTTMDDVVDPTDGQTSLREAIAYAATLDGPQTITFSDTEANGAVNFHDDTFRTITLGGTQLTVSSDVTIEGPGANRLAISGNNQSRVMRFTIGTTSTVNGLTITQGATVGSGGGIVSEFASLTLTRMTISNNQAGDLGGGINHINGTLDVNQSTISGNSAFRGGGGIHTISSSGSATDPAAAIIRNSTISGNTATDTGGGVRNANGVMEITHSTITANTSNSGGGVWSWNDNFTATRIGQSIVAGNVGPDLSGLRSDQPFVSLGHNLVGVAGDGVDFTQDFTETGDQTGVTDPILGPLADNGGPTMTHALLEGSPAIAASVVVEGLDTDQRGVARPQGDTPDIGAFERGLSPQTIDFPPIATQVANVPLTLSATAESGLPVEFEVIEGLATLDGNILTFTGAGTVQVQATQPGDAENLPADPVTRSFLVEKAIAEVTLSNLNQTFTGDPRSVTVTTGPENLTVVVTYDDETTVPTDAGSYAVVATVNDEIYEGSSTETLTINKGVQTIDFTTIPAQEATNTVTLEATATSGLPVVFAVTSGPGEITDGNQLAFTGEGTVIVTASQAGDDNWNAAPDAPQSIVVSTSVATVTLTGLAQTYDGDPKPVGFTTDPENLTVDITYAGETTVPTDAGSYAVVATVNDPLWSGEAMGTLVIAKADQTLSSVSLVEGTRFALNASTTLSGTASSGLPVEFESLTPATVEISGSTATFIGPGEARIRFRQPGDNNWNAAEPMDIEVIVGGEITGLSPDKANIGGGIEVVISGNGLGDGSDITEVLLADVPATILSQTTASVTVWVNAAETAGVGDVSVTSDSGGTMTLEEGFEYLWLVAPEQLDPVDITPESLVARWALVPEADNHLLDVGLDENFNDYLPGFEKLDVVNATQQLIPGLTAGEWYAIRLFAQNEHGLSLPSRTVWVPAGDNIPYETNPPTSGPVSLGTSLFFNPSFMFHGSGMVYTVESSDTDVVQAGIDANGLLRLEMMQPGQAVITVTATDPETGYSSSFSFTIDVVDDHPTVEHNAFLEREPWNMRFTQNVEIRNTSGMDAIGVRVLFSDLADGISVENQTGVSEDGRPMLEVTTGFPAGEVLSFNIVYLATTVSPEVHPPTLAFEYILTDYRPPLPGVGTMITRQILLQDGTGRLVIEFASTPGALYAIEYMNNFPDGAWIEVPLRLRAGANRTQWIDAGPPVTQPMEGVRVYRVKQIAEGEGQ